MEEQQKKTVKQKEDEALIELTKALFSDPDSRVWLEKMKDRFGFYDHRVFINPVTGEPSQGELNLQRGRSMWPTFIESALNSK